MLLHSMPKPVIRGLLTKTLAYQISLPDGHELALPNPIYADDGPGTYAVTMVVGGRQGKFLKRPELGRLCESVERYIEVYEVLKSVPVAAQRTPQQRETVKFAKEVDRQYYKAMSGNRTLLLNDTSLPGVRALQRMLRDWCARATGTRPITQAPLYAGCATRFIEQRARQHRPPVKNPAANYTWYLTTSCMMQMKLAPEVVIVPVIRTWEPHQLPASEILATLMARARVESAGGYNAGQPGSTTDRMAKSPRVWDDDKASVVDRCSYFLEHIRESDEAMRKRAQDIAAIPRLLREIEETKAAISAIEAEIAAECPDPSAVLDTTGLGIQPHVDQAAALKDIVDPVAALNTIRL